MHIVLFLDIYKKSGRLHTVRHTDLELALDGFFGCVEVSLGVWCRVHTNMVIYGFWEAERAVQISIRGVQMWPALSACVKIKGKHSSPNPSSPPSQVWTSTSCLFFVSLNKKCLWQVQLRAIIEVMCQLRCVALVRQIHFTNLLLFEYSFLLLFLHYFVFRLT